MPKKIRVDLTASAGADTSDIWDYIVQDNHEAATAFILHLEEQIATLEMFPQRCPLVPESELLGTTYRHLLFGNYRIIFKITGAMVTVMRILHGARLLDTDILEEVV